MTVESIKFAGRDVPIDQITEVYVDGIWWMVVVYGESAVKIDPQAAYRIAELAPHLVNEKILERREAAIRFQESFAKD